MRAYIILHHITMRGTLNLFLGEVKVYTIIWQPRQPLNGFLPGLERSRHMLTLRNRSNNLASRHIGGIIDSHNDGGRLCVVAIEDAVYGCGGRRKRDYGYDMVGGPRMIASYASWKVPAGGEQGLVGFDDLVLDLDAVVGCGRGIVRGIVRDGGEISNAGLDGDGGRGGSCSDVCVRGDLGCGR